MALDGSTLSESYYPIKMPENDAVHMDMGYLDGVVDGQGVVFEHWRALPCPIGKGDATDIRRVHADHSGCSNGFIYEYAGDMVCIFSGNSKNIQLLDMGLVTGSTVHLTLPRFYKDRLDSEVLVAVFDRLYLKTSKAKVIATELFEHNISGSDRAKYPILKVEALYDSHGKKYAEGTDFDVVGGQIVWKAMKQPGMDPTTLKGDTCSIRYHYTPYWYVNQLLHEIRVLRQADETGRAPMAVLIQREYVFENAQNDREAKNPNDPRQAQAPRDGAFGPR